MKPTSSNASVRGDQSRQAKKPSKGKKTLPTMVYFKTFKNVTPVQSYPPWTGDEASTLKVAVKPIFEDTLITPMLTQNYPSLQRLTQVFQEPIFEDPEATLWFENPEIDPHFSSALFVCLMKGNSFFDAGTFQIFPQEINPIGKYCVKMFENGIPIRLFFDDRLSCDENNKCMMLKHSEPNIITPTLFHKAFLRFTKFGEFTSLDVVTAFTGFVHYEVPLDWANLQFWFGRPDALVALYIRDQRTEGLGSDRLFHIIDMVDLDQHRKFVKLQCPGAQWRGRFSGFEEDTRHWTNQIRVILEIDPETATTANYFWMIYEDLLENFDSIMTFSPPSGFSSNIRKTDQWVPKESQFYNSPPPTLLHCNGTGKIQICTAPLLTSAPTNDFKLTLRRFNWSSGDAPLLLEVDSTAWKTTTLEMTKQDDTLEVECLSKGGFVLQMLSFDTQMEFQDYSDVTTVTPAEGDLPFYVCLDDYATSIFTQRFELIGKVVFNLDQPGNVSFAIFVTNLLQRESMAAILYNNDLDDVVSTKGLRCGSVPITPNKRGYTLLIFGLYNDTIFTHQPAELVGKWRLRIFSDVPLSDIVDQPHLNYAEVEGDCTEMDESHQISRHVLTGGCEAVIVLETSQPQSLTLSVIQDDAQLNSVRGVGFAVLPSCHLPGEKEPTRLIIRGVSSENNTGFSWKLRIFSTGAVGIKEDTAPAEKTAAAIAAWEKKRTVKPAPGKKSESKSRGSNSEPQSALSPPEINEAVLKVIEGEGTVLTQEQILNMIPPPAEPSQQDAHATQQLKNTPSQLSMVNPDPGDSLRDQIASLTTKMNESWDSYEQHRSQITKLFTPTPPKVDEK
ncbi:hypothetical protein TRFO_11266 [Tritrichomonas foetus]|uniref:Calpain catalytic domain-containing protein n=1 Tax=Tritrichomonas foetus TaxID=1144522 RepID=A0A1J4J6A2_9EUKA|nr:hypothetical protein TRFO_11266 [Tritrichomonas foetus]|eukprot:OHS94201.1 hypothetical protein TRFO_11266 [Tritrichomonas foetus]